MGAPSLAQLGNDKKQGKKIFDSEKYNGYTMEEIQAAHARNELLMAGQNRGSSGTASVGNLYMDRYQDAQRMMPAEYQVGNYDSLGANKPLALVNRPN